jgi:hypothetical protein
MDLSEKMNFENNVILIKLLLSTIKNYILDNVI